MAVHLGSFLAQRHAQKTLIVDQHPYLGHVALLLGMDGHSYNLHELLHNISRLDLMLLKSYVAHHSSGVDVLPSPDSLSETGRDRRPMPGGERSDLWPRFTTLF